MKIILTLADGVTLDEFNETAKQTIIMLIIFGILLIGGSIWGGMWAENHNKKEQYVSKKAVKHLEKAVQLYLDEDGASDIGAYRDAVTDILHLARKKFPRDTRFGSDLKGWILDEAWNMVEEEVLNQELETISKTPKEDLPLLQTDDFETEAAQLELETRLKGDGNGC